LLWRHSLIDLTVQAKGDLEVDAHHTVEDVGLVMGQALAQALGEKRGIYRYGWAIVPMDESLAQVAIDLSGRPAFVYNVKYSGGAIGNFPVELVEEFFKAVAINGKLNLHINVPYGGNNHHIAEAIFKATAKAIRQAVSLDPRNADVPSTKGTL
jgi:imidazoleglycerol-phosphate dehydratase